MPKNTQQTKTNPKKNPPKKNAKKTTKAKAKVKPKTKEEIKSFVFRHVKPSRKLGSGGVLRKSKDLGRLIRWPKYVKLQRQKKILFQRLKIPPAINIFSESCGKPFAKTLITFFLKYSPETKKQKRDRKRAWAKLQAENKPIPSEKRIVVKCGFNHVTNLIEKGSAKLVLIAHDVDPVELVLWMPTLCVKKDVPFVIIKSKQRLGTLVHKKTATCVALCDVNPGDKDEFQQITTQARKQFNDRLTEMKRRWGNRVLGIKTRHKIEKRLRVRQEEAAKRKAAQVRDKEEREEKTKE